TRASAGSVGSWPWRWTLQDRARWSIGKSARAWTYDRSWTGAPWVGLRLHGTYRSPINVRKVALDPVVTRRIPAAGIEVPRRPVLALHRDAHAQKAAADAVALEPVEQAVADVPAAICRRHHHPVDVEQDAVH